MFARDLMMALAVSIIGTAVAPAVASAQATVTSGTILSATVDVTKPAASPLVKLRLSGSPTQVSLTYQSPSGSGFTQQFYDSSPSFPKTAEFQGYVGPQFTTGVFSLYAEPGSWALSDIIVCGATGCSNYYGTALSALFPSLTVTVLNPNKPDITPPVATAANIKTPSVSIANGPALDIRLNATDDLSGVAYATVCATPASASGYVICAYSSPAAQPLISAKLSLSTPSLPFNSAGVYTVTSVTLNDIAGNFTFVTDPAAISALFKGKTTITITN